MRVPSVGWAFFGLTVAGLLVYVLNMGVFIGSDVVARLNPFNGKTYYLHSCSYLHLTGIRRATERSVSSMKDTPEEAAENSFCPAFGNSN